MRNWLSWAACLALYGGLFVVFTWPLAADFSTSFLAVPGGDSYVFVWDVWWFRKAVFGGLNPYFTDWLFYPHGSGLIMHGFTPVLGLLGLALGGDVVGVNAGLLLSCAFSGLGAYLLARRWVRSPALALLAGFVFTYSPYKLERLTQHFNLQLTATLPFYILLFLRAFAFAEGRFWPQVRSWRAVAGCFALGAFTLLCDYYVLFGMIYFSLAYAAWFWFGIGRLRWRAWRTWLGLASILAVSHVAIRLMRLAGIEEKSIWWGGDVVSFFMPPPTSRFGYWDWAARLAHDPRVFNAPGSLENTLYIGYVLPLLALALWALRLAGRRPPSVRSASPEGRPLAWVLVVFLLFTVPSLRVFGHERLNLPTAAIHFIPFFNNIRCPTRWMMMVGLLLPIVSFSALEAAWASRLRPLGRALLTVALAAVVLIEFWPRPYQRASRAAVPQVFLEAARLPGTTLIPIPLGMGDGTRHLGEMQPEQMFYQTLHQKKLPFGYLSRVGPELFAAFAADPVLRWLVWLQGPQPAAPPATTSAAPPAPTPAQTRQFLRVYDPAGFVVSPAFRNQAVHRGLWQLLQPLGYRQQPQPDGYVLLLPPVPASSGPVAVPAFVPPAANANPDAALAAPNATNPSSIARPPSNP